MLYFIDTCICVEYLRGKNEDVRRKIDSYDPRQIKIPIVVMAELLYGAYKSKRAGENVKDVMNFVEDFEIIPVDLPEADLYGQIRASLGRKGQPIGNNDMLIAATALTHNATLVTNNTGEFSRIDGLKLEDWTL